MSTKELAETCIEKLENCERPELAQLLLEQVNEYGNRILEDHFPSQRKFYGKIFNRHAKITEEDIHNFQGCRKGQPYRPCFILTRNGCTRQGETLAQKKGILLLTFSELANYLRMAKLSPQKYLDFDIEFLH